MATRGAGDPAGAPALGDVPEGGTRDNPESAYRRGYVDGWVNGMDRFHGMMLDDRLSRQAAYDACWSYWQRELFEWYDGFREALTADNPLTPTEPERPQVSRRRGYRDGWIEALDAMWDLMFANNMTREPAYARCRQHLEDELLPWRDGDCSQLVIPPPLPRRRG